MALAYLCRQWEIQRQKERKDNFQGSNASPSGMVLEKATSSVTAFVVDHKARQESTQEANTVAGWLRDLGAVLFPLHFSSQRTIR